MIITHEREKLIHAINFFAQNTRKLGKTKLFKLLYFTDFEHFKQTGRSMTGLGYFAWPMGPVPVSLQNEIPAPQPDMEAIVSFEEIALANGSAMTTVKPKADFASHYFSPRELRIMGALAGEHYNSDANAMVEATHLENLPWDRVYNQENKQQAEIPYELALKADEKDMIMKIASDRAELLANLK